MFILPSKSRSIKQLLVGLVDFQTTITTNLLQKVLNEKNYTVWIDMAGIRAGQKWRTEIAHGIHVSKHPSLYHLCHFESQLMGILIYLTQLAGLSSDSLYNDTTFNQLPVLSR